RQNCSEHHTRRRPIESSSLRLHRGFFRPGLAAIAGLGGALGGVGVAVDHLQVGQTPITKELRPRLLAMLLEHPEQRHAVIDLGGLEEPLAALAAAPLLQSPEEAHVVAWRAPELPRDHADRMPGRVAVWSCMPQVGMPAELEHRLPADTAE